jgi:shikimate kinase
VSARNPVRVLLVGMMATGKTTIGTAVSARTGWPYVDNDALLQRATGRTAAQLLAEEGQPALRRGESDVLTVLLGMPAPLVAGVAAGVVLDAADRERLHTGGHVVWLRASVPVLVRRVGRASDRPWLGDDPARALAELAAERDPLYAEIAHQALDVDVLTPQRAARAVVDGLPVTR